jgi:DNA-binding response OmpR family regulator
MKKILLVEDDKSILLGLSYSLETEGYKVESCSTVQKARELLLSEAYDLLLLDLTLPDGSGYDVCRIARSETSTPVIFLTACDDEVNVVMGLDMGADDYITKPFASASCYRIKTVIRRNERSADTGAVIQLGNLAINTSSGKISRGDTDVLLTALEYRLLLTLVNHEGQILTRSQLLEGIWDVGGDFVNDNTLTVYIKRLREKIEDDPAHPDIILTVRGLGTVSERNGGDACTGFRTGNPHAFLSVAAIGLACTCWCALFSWELRADHRRRTNGAADGRVSLREAALP